MSDINLVSSSRHPTQFSLTYGFYVVLGGLVVDVSDIYDNIRKMGWESFSMSDRDIRDKSKADNLSKVLVILQVSWTFLQCISRQASGYPLTLLEVHILVHAACAMLMYALWFHKPLDVGDPSSVTLGPVSKDVALALVRSSGSAYKPFTAIVGPQTQFKTSDSEYVLDFLDLILDPGSKKQLPSEGDLLIFNTKCLQYPHEGSNDSEPLAESILDTLAVGHKSTGETGIQAAAEADQSQMDPGELESQMGRKSSGQETTLYRQSNGPGDRSITHVGNWSWGLRQRVHRIIQLSITKEYRENSRAQATDCVTIPNNEIDPWMKPLLGDERRHRSHLFKVTVCLSRKDLLRWHRAGLAYRHELTAEASKDSDCDDSHATGGIPQISRSATPCLRSLQAEDYSDRTSTHSNGVFVLRSPHLSFETTPALRDNAQYLDKATQAIVSMTLVSAAYAGVHVALWNYEFPTEVENLLWRVASCALGAPLAIIPGICSITACFSLWRQIKALALLLAEALGSLKAWSPGRRSVEPASTENRDDSATTRKEPPGRVTKKMRRLKIDFLNLLDDLLYYSIIFLVFPSMLASMALYVLSRLYIGWRRSLV
ncbi:hypothetical protein EDD36DRAFT_417890 [Exophiala viscosa]|uniref:Uncharacterized protein n=1 Tax=Exophiala viscosa TaxID=2486360 RepID=A0AAN6DXI4_9EURO|nr:hypothetical protein EDD36DRAFT_417890 [Exophiala viscosa]